MNNEKEIKNIAEIINNRVGTNLNQIHGTKSGFGKCADITTTVSTKLIAKEIVKAGYGDIKQAIKEFSQKAISLIHRYCDSETDYTPSLTCSDIFDMLIKELYGE